MSKKKMNYKEREGMRYVRVVPKFLQGMVEEQEYQGKYDEEEELEDRPDPELERMKQEYIEQRLKEEMDKDSTLQRKRTRPQEIQATQKYEEEEEEEEGQHRFRKPPVSKKRKVTQPPKTKKHLEGEDGKSEEKEKKGFSSVEEENKKEGGASLVTQKEGKEKDQKSEEKEKQHKKEGKGPAPKKKRKKGSVSLLSFDVDE